MSDNASWFYGERLPEIARENNCSLKEAERIFMDEKSREKITNPKTKTIEVDIEEPVLNKLMLLAHQHNITLNQLVGKSLQDQLVSAEYQFEHGKQLLTEN